jgi:hypothetical protein
MLNRRSRRHCLPIAAVATLLVAGGWIFAQGSANAASEGAGAVQVAPIATTGPGDSVSVDSHPRTAPAMDASMPMPMPDGGGKP